MFPTDAVAGEGGGGSNKCLILKSIFITEGEGTRGGVPLRDSKGEGGSIPSVICGDTTAAFQFSAN